VSDRIVLANMRFMGRHGVHDWEQRDPQPFEVDVELYRDLRRAGGADDLEATIDYGIVYAKVQAIVEGSSMQLLEALAAAIADSLLADLDVTEVAVRVRKPAVRLGGPLDYAGVEIRRARADLGSSD
jgi:dihydroneopterin aldolase